MFMSDRLFCLLSCSVLSVLNTLDDLLDDKNIGSPKKYKMH